MNGLVRGLSAQSLSPQSLTIWVPAFAGMSGKVGVSQPQVPAPCSTPPQARSNLQTERPASRRPPVSRRAQGGSRSSRRLASRQPRHAGRLDAPEHGGFPAAASHTGKARFQSQAESLAADTNCCKLVWRTKVRPAMRLTQVLAFSTFFVCSGCGVNRTRPIEFEHAHLLRA